MNTCVKIYNGRMWVRAANIGDEDIYLKQRSMIGAVSFCDVKSDNSDI